MAVSNWPGLGCQSAWDPLDVIGDNEYFGWFDAGGGGDDDRDALSPFLDSVRACYPNKAIMVTEFGFDGNRNGPVEERGTYAFQANSVAFHLGVFASKPWLSGAMYFALRITWRSRRTRAATRAPTRRSTRRASSTSTGTRSRRGPLSRRSTTPRCK